jgi:hypothetical protein
MAFMIRRMPFGLDFIRGGECHCRFRPPRFGRGFKDGRAVCPEGAYPRGGMVASWTAGMAQGGQPAL